MWNLKYDTNELIYKTETDLENKVMVTKGEKGWLRYKSRVWNQQIQTTIYKIDKQQGPIVQHREQYSISYNLYGKESEKEQIYNYLYIYTHIYKSITESLCCTPESNTIL